ncbi:MAG: hypothetical protein ACXADD_18375 [Candidatus Thorarchaeota archaeon]|jgi:hypothetical protein
MNGGTKDWWQAIASGSLIVSVIAIVIATSYSGPQGETGPQGLQGERGLQGLQGEKGDPGEILVVPMTAGTGTVIVRVENTESSSELFDVYAHGKLEVDDSPIAPFYYDIFAVEVDLTFDCESVGVYAVYYSWGYPYEDQTDINLCKGQWVNVTLTPA